MPINLVICLDVLLDSKKQDVLNQTRFNELKPYLNSSRYELVILSVNRKSEFNSKIYSELRSQGLTPQQFLVFFNSKQLHEASYKKPFFLFEKKSNAEFLKYKAYLSQKNQQEERQVVVIGIPTDRQLTEWIQANYFSLLDWPHGSDKSLNQLFHEQLSFSSQKGVLPDKNRLDINRLLINDGVRDTTIHCLINEDKRHLVCDIKSLEEGFAKMEALQKHMLTLQNSEKKLEIVEVVGIGVTLIATAIHIAITYREYRKSKSHLLSACCLPRSEKEKSRCVTAFSQELQQPCESEAVPLMADRNRHPVSPTVSPAGQVVSTGLYTTYNVPSSTGESKSLSVKNV